MCKSGASGSFFFIGMQLPRGQLHRTRCAARESEARSQQRSPPAAKVRRTPAETCRMGVITGGPRCCASLGDWGAASEWTQQTTPFPQAKLSGMSVRDTVSSCPETRSKVTGTIDKTPWIVRPEPAAKGPPGHGRDDAANMWAFPA